MTIQDDDSPWGIWVDIEGFSNLWSAGDLGLRGLAYLTSLVFALGKRCYPHPPDRLFAHQIGDGFYIASDFHEPSLDRCAAIAVCLLRGLAKAGFVGRATIAEGALADYSGCRPPEVRAAARRGGDSDVVSLGEGLMTLQAVMGQGIVNAVALDKLSGTKGSLLCIHDCARHRLSDGFVARPLASSPDIFAIDWVHSTSPIIDGIGVTADFGTENPDVLGKRLADYIARHALRDEWVRPTLEYCGL